jgi:outer membrane protein assembly factor BamB
MTWFGHWILLIMLALGPHQRPSPTSPLNNPYVKAWSYLTTDTLRYNGAVADGQHVFVPLRDGQLMAFQLNTGEQAWTAQYQMEWTTGVSFDDRALYLASASSASDTNQSYALLAVDKQTGQILWQKPWNERITSLTHRPSTETAGSARIYLGTVGGSFMAIDPSSQQMIWQINTGQPVSARAREHDGVVYTGSDDGHVYALDAMTGHERWRFKTGAPVRARVEVGADRIFAGSFDGSVYCLDRSNGHQRWKMRTGAAIAAQPLLVQNRLIVSSYDNFAYALRAKSGTVQWKTKLPGRLMADSIVSGETVLLSALRASNVVALLLSEGQVAGSLELGKGIEIVAAPVMSSDILVLTTDRGIIAARSVAGRTIRATASP